MNFHTIQSSGLIRNHQLHAPRTQARQALNTPAPTIRQESRDQVAIRADLFTPSQPGPQETPPKPTAPVETARTSAPAPDNGNVVYRSGLDVVTMNPDGTLGMSFADDDHKCGFGAAVERGLESSGSVLKLVMMDAAGIGNRVGRALGVDEKAPGIRGAVGTAISAGAALVGGLVAIPLAGVVGVVDGIGG